MPDIYQELLLLVGKDIEFLKPIEEYVDTFDAGMRATVTSIAPDGGCHQIRFTFAKFEEFNGSIAKATFYDADGNPRLTAQEAGMYTVEDYLYVEADWQKCVKVLGNREQTLLRFFTADKEANPDMTYVAWLEHMVASAMSIKE